MAAAHFVDAPELDRLNAAGSLLVVCFLATWNRRCQGFMPGFEAAAVRFSQVATWVCVDVDESSALAARFEVCSVPTVLLLQRGRVLDRDSSLSLTTIEARLAAGPDRTGGTQGAD
jgi:thioredoxin-like negative regulator of GroEL